jgi:cytochrome P450
MSKMDTAVGLVVKWFPLAITTTAVIISFGWRKRMQRIEKQYPPAAKSSFSFYLDFFLKGKVHVLQLRFIRESKDLLIVHLPFPTARPTFLVAEASVARKILEGDSSSGIPESDKSFRYKLLEKLTCGVGTILTKKTHGEDWALARKGVGPSFSMSNLNRLLPALQKKLGLFNRILREHADEGKILEDLATWGVCFTLDFITTSMFDTDFSALDERYANLCGGGGGGGHVAAGKEEKIGTRFLRDLKAAMLEFTLRQPLNPLRQFMFWKKEVWEAQRAATSLEAMGQQLLDTYRQTHSDEELKADRSSLACIIRSPYPSDQARVADITTFLIAGHDTTGYQIAWIIIELARNPRVVEVLRAELDRVLGPGDVSDENPITPDQLAQLVYLGQVIKEGQRLWPVTAVGPNRELAVDIRCSDTVLLPKGSYVSVGFFAMFRSGIHDADSFIPERWNEDDPDAAKLQQMFIPFSIGKRNCLGMPLANLELKMGLATIFKTFDFELLSEVDDYFFLTLKPQNANMRVTLRKDRAGGQ